MRRNLNMLYLIENNGVYGLTKGQFSASADIGTKAKKGEENQQPPIDPVLTALTLGCTFIARSFSGDKEQLVPLIIAGMKHRGFAMIDVLSPCVTFNDHEGSTKSYEFVRDHYDEVVHADFVPPAREITAQYAHGDAVPVTLHDGSRVLLRKLDPSYDPTHRGKAFNYLRDKLAQNEYVTGLIYIDESSPDFHEMNGTTATPINQLPYSQLTPGSKGLEKILSRYR
jgi:2-oxoglutarate ferredoxin oxidoreductase subunit beta